MAVKVDMRSKKSMHEYMRNHEHHGDYNSPQAYSHCVKVNSLIEYRVLKRLTKEDMDSLVWEFESLIEQFNENNPKLRIYQTGRSGGHIELWTANSMYYTNMKGEIEKRELDKPYKWHDEDLSYYDAEGYTIEDWRIYCADVKLFDKFFDDMKKHINKLAAQLVNEREALANAK